MIISERVNTVFCTQALLYNGIPWFHDRKEELKHVTSVRFDTHELECMARIMPGFDGSQ